jgi:hypothetical protein
MQWEYYQHECTTLTPDVKETLKTLGLEGWELVNFGGEKYSWWFFFKKPLNEHL